VNHSLKFLAGAGFSLVRVEFLTDGKHFEPGLLMWLAV